MYVENIATSASEVVGVATFPVAAAGISAVVVVVVGHCPGIPRERSHDAELVDDDFHFPGILQNNRLSLNSDR